MTGEDQQPRSLMLSTRARRRQRLGSLAGQSFLFLITSLSSIAVLFIFVFIARDAIPFFQLRGFREFFTSTHWYPSHSPAEFGVLAIFFGSGIVTLGATAVAVPLGVLAAICLSDVLPFGLRQVVKPIIEMLAAIPSVAYGFFALVVLAPLMQERGGGVLVPAAWLIGAPFALLTALVLSETASHWCPDRAQRPVRFLVMGVMTVLAFAGLQTLSSTLRGLQISSGANALNASVILGIMALPTVVSVSEDALQSVGRDLRMASYALGATRAETLLRVVIPAGISGIAAAVILGVMRAIGETMVVWMASGNAAQIPQPWFNLLEPVRTLTATIAGDMGEADQVTGSARYHVLFAMALCLLAFSFACNIASEWIVARTRRKAA